MNVALVASEPTPMIKLDPLPRSYSFQELSTALIRKFEFWSNHMMISYGPYIDHPMTNMYCSFDDIVIE